MTDRLPRKLAAILYADVAEYSRLTGDDEDATHRTLSKYLDLIAHTVDSHRGQVMHYAGDAVLARFDAVVDALSSASDIQRQLADQNIDLPDESKLHFRIGVNLGDVIEDRGDIYGDGVNIAARLESLADPGGICVSEAVRSAVNKKIDLNYEDMGEPALKNIEEPVRAYRVVMVSSPLQAPDSTSEAGTSSLLEFTPPTRPSIAILPFKSLGSDPDQEFLADGIRLGIQATLVQLSGLFLINASALNAYRQSDATAIAVGSELGVRYVLEGSAQQAGDRIRVTVQLTDIDAKQAIWAERYDRTLDDIFKLQDEITWEVIISLNVKIQTSESVRVWFGKLTNAEAREYYYRGVSLIYEGNKDDNALSRHMFEELYRVEPDSVIGPSNISLTHWLDAFIFSIDSANESIKQAAKWARKAMQYDDNNGIGHAVYGHLQLLDGQYEDALATCAKGIKLRSSCPLAHGLMGLVLNYSGDARGAIKNLREALQLENVYPAWMIDILAAAYRDCGEVELSISAAKESIRLNPQKDEAQLILCSGYELTNDHDQARRAAGKIIANNPAFRLADYAKSQPYQHPAPLERFIEALREAGLPE